MLRSTWQRDFVQIAMSSIEMLPTHGKQQSPCPTKGIETLKEVTTSYEWEPMCDAPHHPVPPGPTRIRRVGACGSGAIPLASAREEVPYLSGLVRAVVVAIYTAATWRCYHW
jgi:hypothetical protein